MTREERTTKLKAYITCLKCQIKGHACDVHCPTMYEAGNIGEIVENLEAISKALDQEPCEDCVSRQAVRDTIFAECSGTKLDIDFAKVLLLQRAIKALPPVTPARKKGKWVDKEKITFPICSKCGLTSVEKYNFCPNCGAKMVEPQESEEK